MNKKTPLVSVIIPTFNSGKTISLCLKSVQKQIYRKLEIIIVDNYSTDNTLKIARQYTENFYLCDGERSKQRNFGIKKAKGDFILYLDSDMVLSRSVVSEAIFKIRDCVGLYIPEIVEGNSFFAKLLNFERSFYNSTVVDAVRFVRKDILLKEKGFDENLISCEDWDLDRRIKKYGKTSIITSPLYHMQYGLTLNKFFLKKMYYFKHINLYINKWGKNDLAIKKQFGFRYRYIDVFFENGKWKKLINQPGLSFCMFGSKILFGLFFIFFRIFQLNYKYKYKAI